MTTLEPEPEPEPLACEPPALDDEPLEPESLVDAFDADPLLPESVDTVTCDDSLLLTPEPLASLPLLTGAAVCVTGASTGVACVTGPEAAADSLAAVVPEPDPLESGVLDTVRAGAADEESEAGALLDDSDGLETEPPDEASDDGAAADDCVPADDDSLLEVCELLAGALLGGGGGGS